MKKLQDEELLKKQNLRKNQREEKEKQAKAEGLSGKK